MSAPGGAFDALLRTPFYKMSGSGNDFVFFDAREHGAPATVDPARIAAICARGEGIGADGVVLLDQPGAGTVRIAYYNSDGSRAALCGNATLCTAALAVRLDAVASDAPFRIVTDTGVLDARVDLDLGASFALPAIEGVTPELSDLAPEGAGAAAERRAGYALTGVPHIVIWVGDVRAVDLASRGPVLRRPHPDRPEGANVNYVSQSADGRWDLRTFERGVEGETLACGTGAVAAAVLLRRWGLAGSDVALRTRSGRILTVALGGSGTQPTLAGEGRLVFTGTLEPDA